MPKAAELECPVVQKITQQFVERRVIPAWVALLALDAQLHACNGDDRQVRLVRDVAAQTRTGVVCI